ncbi:hypothetical protein GGX14DRAFT_662207 [Mycena pura]|uniref:BZIP domain-containing protein n=1 Tax=Mycena pura TaxID=153505 RepID=A0AAD6V7C3_9AGAR|nr:hypothetical protein GGX14DRAFT_662207 [Mycena pura]
MLVDNPMSQSYLFPPSYTDYNQDLNDIFHTELFSSSAASSSSQSSGSRESTPSLLTPPQAPPAASFPEINDPTSPVSTSSLFNFLDEDVKTLDPLSLLSSHPYGDLFAPFPAGGGGSSSGAGGSSPANITEADLANFLGGIDPQLVGSPATDMFAEFDSDANATSPASSSSQPSASSPEELAIVPVKVGGFGKARKGTVVGGGVKKASASASAAPNKENAGLSSFTTSSIIKPRQTSVGEDDDDDDVPDNWRPAPEVFAKMTSKEKRQLRNKISARNFRVRRKEYISTLEENIAERDHLLDAIRAELGSTQSENVALRQEIAALKRTLLENRGPAPVLPPPAPLSVSSSPILSATSTPVASTSKEATTSALPPLNTHKDLSATSQRFWGGVTPLGGGYTSVHTARIPDLLGASPFASSPFASAMGQESPAARHQQENLNPALNGGKVAEVLRTGIGLGLGTGAPNASATGDAFGDANPFTVRNLDAYRMHLWSRMAAQYRFNKEHGAASNKDADTSPSPFASAGSWKAHSPPHSPPFPLSGLAGGLRPKYFQSPSANGLAASFSGLSLSGKGASLPTPAPTPTASLRAKEKERETAMYAALASQTLVRRLGSAFWDAFSGHERPSSSSSSSSASASASRGGWDAEKVRKVLEGKAVVRVVDVEPAPPKPAAAAPAATQRCSVEECMRSLTLGKKQ